MNIFALADLESDWYPKNALNLFKQYSNFDFVQQPQSADLIWIFSYYTDLTPILLFPQRFYTVLPWSPRRSRAAQLKPIVTTLHHLTPTKKKFWSKRIALLDQLTDYWQTFSAINQTYFAALLRKPQYRMPYWIDINHFHPLPDPEKEHIRRQLNLPTNKIIIGSFQRDTESDLITPKREKGPDIFCDIVERVPNMFVLLAGPRRHYVTRRLQQAGIPYRNLGRIPYQEMNKLYNALDYYLVTSRYEGGPQAILESMASKTPILSTPVGIANILDQRVIHTKAADFATAIRRPYPPVLEQHYRVARQHHAPVVIKQYEQYLSSLAR